MDEFISILGTAEVEEEIDFDNDKVHSLLFTNAGDHNYLQSHPELHREVISGDQFDKLKNKIGMNRALKEVARLGNAGMER
jgi:hypothetical protein